MRCSRCGKSYGGIMAALNTDLARPICPECEAAQAEEKRKAEAERREASERAAKVLLTTTPGVDGCRVISYLGIESVEVVMGTGVFSELSGDIADFFGQRSKGFESKLQQAKDLAFRLLREKAYRRGANAVIAVDMDYAEFSGNRVALIVNGTLVRLAREKGEGLPVPAPQQPAPPPIEGAPRRKLLGEVEE